MTGRLHGRISFVHWWKGPVPNMMVAPRTGWREEAQSPFSSGPEAQKEGLGEAGSREGGGRWDQHGVQSSGQEVCQEQAQCSGPSAPKTTRYRERNRTKKIFHFILNKNGTDRTLGNPGNNVIATAKFYRNHRTGRSRAWAPPPRRPPLWRGQGRSAWGPEQAGTMVKPAPDEPTGPPGSRL